MDLTSSSSSPPQNSSKDFVNLINHPQNEDIHNQGSGFSSGNNGINNKEEILPSFDFQPLRPVSASLDAPGVNNNSRSCSSIDAKIKMYGSLDSIEPVKDILEKDQKGFDTSLVAAIDRTMKKHTDNLMHMLEGVGDRLTQLESRTSKLETSVDDLKMSVGNNHGSIDGKMRQLENILKEVQTEVHVVKEKQESVEALLQHAKLQETKMDQPSETHNTAHIGSMQQAASAPFQSHQQLPLAASFPQSLSSVPPPPPPTVPPPALPQQNLRPPVQHPEQFPQSQVPPVAQGDAYYTPPAQTQEIPSQQFPMPPTQQVPPVPQRDAYYTPPGQTQEAPSQHFPMPPTLQQQPPLAAPTHQAYQPAPPLQYSQPPQPLQGQPSMGHHPDEAAYVPSQTYPPNLRQPPSQQPSGPPSSQQYFGIPPQMHEPPSRRPGLGFSTGYVPQSGPSEQYAYGGSPPQYGSASPMKLQQLPSSTGSGYPQLPTARVLPHALPTVSGGGGESASSGSGNRVPIDDVVDKVTSMGFPRDHVRATVRKLTENGQSVDLNVVLDKLMNDSDIQPPRAWIGRFSTYLMSNLHDKLAILACEGWSWDCHALAPLMATGLAIFCCAWWLWRGMKFTKINPPLPPGPLGLPIIGNLPFIQPQLHRYFSDLSRIYGPIIKLRMGRMIVIVINSPSLANEVLKVQDAIFANRDIPAAAVVGTFGGLNIAWRPKSPGYNRLRKLVVCEIMSKQSLDACYVLHRREVRRMVTEIHGKVGSLVNIDEQLSATALRLMTSTLWGDDPSQDLIELRKRLGEFIITFATPNVSDLFPILAPFDLQGIESKAKEQLSWFYGVFESMIKNRRNIGDDGKKKEKISKDFMQQLLELHQRGDDNSSLSLNEVKALLLDLVVAGTDTIPNTVEWTMTELLRHPDKMTKLIEELNMVVGNQNTMEESYIPQLVYLDAVIKETLRLHPVAPLLLPHVPSETTIIGGYTIPKGCRVFINAWAMQRDLELWDDPLRFQPERFLETDINYRDNNFKYLPFGSGRRMCVGISMAKKMAALLVGSLVHSFEWRLSEETKLNLEDKFGLVLKKTESLVAIPIARLPNLEQYK